MIQHTYHTSSSDISYSPTVTIVNELTNATQTLTITPAITILRAAMIPTTYGTTVNTNLVVGGTPGQDTIVVNTIDPTNISVTINNVTITNPAGGTFAVDPATGHVIIHGCGGTNDSIQLIGTLNGELYADGGVNSTITGGGGNDIIYGGTGRAFLYGGGGDDLLVAGTCGYPTFRRFRQQHIDCRQHHQLGLQLCHPGSHHQCLVPTRHSGQRFDRCRYLHPKRDHDRRAGSNWFLGNFNYDSITDFVRPRDVETAIP